MSRNDQVIRQWHLLRRLKSARGVTIEELTESLPDDYRRHPRTLRRDLEAHVQDAFVVMRGQPVTVELLFSKAAAPWVKDRVWHRSQTLTPQKGGRLKMLLRVGDTPELIGWILSFGGEVQVRKPAALAEKVREQARRILQSALIEGRTRSALRGSKRTEANDVSQKR